MNDYKNPDVLKRLYWDEGLSQSEIGDRLGEHRTTIQYWIEKHDIKQRTPMKERVPNYSESPAGYFRWLHEIDGTQYGVQGHRLLAVAKYGFEAVTKNDVHHVNGCGLDNRTKNIMLLDHKFHGWISRTPGRERELQFLAETIGV